MPCGLAASRPNDRSLGVRSLDAFTAVPSMEDFHSIVAHNHPHRLRWADHMPVIKRFPLNDAPRPARRLEASMILAWRAFAMSSPPLTLTDNTGNYISIIMHFTRH